MPGIDDNEDLSLLDRGDNFEPEPKAATKVDEPTDDPFKKDGIEEPEGKGEEQPRGPDGKFAKKDDGDEPRIPKSRFDEAVAKERERVDALERELAEIRAKISTKQEEKAPEVDPRVAEIQSAEAKIDEMEAKFAELLADGQSKEAAELRRQIRAEDRKLATLETAMASEKTAAQVSTKMTQEQQIERETALVNGAVDHLEAEYPVLNKDSNEYNPRFVDLIVAEQQRLMSAERLTPSQALAKAGKEIMELYGATKNKEEPKKDDKAEGRRQEALKKSVDAAKKQPGSMRDVGLDSGAAGAKSSELDVDKMTDKEFGALTEEQLTKLRGDYV